MFATEYRKIDPNMILSLPFRSPSTPQMIPPRSMPAICMFSRKTPVSINCWPERPSDLRLAPGRC